MKWDTSPAYFPFLGFKRATRVAEKTSFSGVPLPTSLPILPGKQNVKHILFLWCVYSKQFCTTGYWKFKISAYSASRLMQTVWQPCSRKIVCYPRKEQLACCATLNFPGVSDDTNCFYLYFLFSLYTRNMFLSLKICSEK